MVVGEDEDWNNLLLSHVQAAVMGTKVVYNGYNKSTTKISVHS